MKKLESTDPRIQKAITLYKSGKGIRPICKELHIDSSVLRKFIIEEGLLRTAAEAARNGKSDAKINDNVFDILTPEALYWIGFIYTDGTLEKEPRTRIAITLAEKDKDHLEKYSKFIGEEVPIINVTGKNRKNNPAPGQINFDYKYFRVGFSSKRLYNRLKELGIGPNKTQGLIPNDLLKGSRDFWRGCVDGDGWVCETGDKRAEGKYNYTCIGLSGTEDSLLGFLEFIKKSGIITQAIPHKDKRSNVWKIDIHSSPAKKVLNLLYKDSTIYLDRKYKKYQELVSSETI